MKRWKRNISILSVISFLSFLTTISFYWWFTIYPSTVREMVITVSIFSAIGIICLILIGEEIKYKDVVG